MVRLTALIIAFIFVQGCTQSMGLQKQSSFSAHDLESGRLLYIEPDVSVKELGMAGAEEVPEWTEEGKQNLNVQMHKYLRGNTGLKLVESRALSPDQQVLLEEHIALYSLVAGQHLTFEGPYSAGWKSVKPNNQFTLGPGLKFLKDKNGLDMALMTVAEDLISSEGRIATQVLLVLLGSGVQGGYCALHSGIIDLETGDVQWTNTAFSTTHTLRSRPDTAEMVKQLFEGLPLVPQEAR